MNGIHDMGGMHGFGPIEYEENEPVFHAVWEGRMYGLRRAIARYQITAPHGSRYVIESLDPAVYLTSSYYERWLLTTEKALIEKGLLTAEELDAKTEFFREHREASLPRREDPEELERILTATYYRQPLHREVGVVPRFKVGDRVKARNINPMGHTRLPRYVRGKRGVIARYHGVHDFQDTVPEGFEAKPQPVYSVRFEGSELWGDVAEANQSLYIDMWESYMEPV
ncbi:MAG: nitrile hydratase subunit beta [Dehalococcoidia bacterium]